MTKRGGKRPRKRDGGLGVTTMDRSRRLLLAAGLLVAVGVTARTAWADEISCKAGISCYGASGLDELRGTKKKDNLCGEVGNDTLLGRGANDFLAGDAPIDTGCGWQRPTLRWSGRRHVQRRRGQ
jgi:Ca2+-binding RTX toxin-like protein